MRKIVIVGIAVVAVVVVIVAALLIQRATVPVFDIIDYNWDLDTDFDDEFNPIYTVTIWIKVKNDGRGGRDTIVCEVTRNDLTKITRTRKVFISAGQTKIVEFVFSNSELKGAIPKEYKAWVV